MKCLYLHIGMPKTGSSAIQAFLTLNSQTLNNHGILFPNPPEFTQPFQTSMGNARILYDFLYNNDIQKLEDYLASFDNEATVLLSSESLYVILRDNPQRLFHALENYEYRIICYIRRQDEIFSSSYNQLVKNNNETNRPIIDEIAAKNDFALVLSESLKYCQVDRLIIRAYEKQQFYGDNIYADFLQCIGIKLTDDYVFPEKIVNPSLSKEALEFRRILNILEIDLNDAKKKIYINGLLGQYTVEQQLGRPFQEESNIFTAEERIQIIKEFEEKNQFVARAFLNRKDGKLFYDPMPAISKMDVQVQPQVPLSIANALGICRFLLKNNDIEHMEEELIKILAQGTIDRIFKSEIDVQIDEMPITYRMQEEPVYFSQDVIKLERKYGLLLLESSGSDPNFILPNYYNNTNERVLIIEVKITVSSDTLLQLFYTSDNPEFDPQHCLSQRIKKGYNEIILKIEEMSPISSLRIDPGTTEGIYLLHDIIVRNPMKVVRKRNSPMTYHLEKYPVRCSSDVKAMEKKNDTWHIESSGTDPFFILSDFYSLTNEGELWVEIQITVPFDTELQLFYLTDNPEFDPYHCRSRYLNKGDNRLSIYIHEQHPITALRLDPGTTEGIYILHHFKVKNFKEINNPKTKPTEVLLHVGLHKTGTTSIQETLIRHTLYLEEKGYLYPQGWIANHSIPIYSIFSDHPERYHINMRHGLSEEEVRKTNQSYLQILEEEISEKSFSTLILSGEDICLLTQDNLINLKEYFIKLFGEDIRIKALIYLRNPITWAVSMLQESIKGGFDPYQNALTNVEYMLSDLFEENINKFVKVFGRKAVQIETFEKAIAHKEGPVGHFLTTLGFDQGDIKQFQFEKSNESVSLLAADMISYINEKLPLFGFEKRSLFVFDSERLPLFGSENLNVKRSGEDSIPLYHIGGSKFDIPEEAKKKLDAISLEDRIWLKDNWGIDYLDIHLSTNPRKIEFSDEIMQDIKKAYSELSEPLQELVLEYLQNHRKKSPSLAEQARISKLLKELRPTYLNKETELEEALQAKEMLVSEYKDLNDKMQREFDQNKLDYASLIREREDLARQLTELSVAYQVISTSASWKITKPLRRMLDLTKKLM